MTRALFACALAAAVAATAPLARADDGTSLERAQALFRVGAQAYAKGDFTTAIDAFEEAYRASERPGILFSIGQAHRKEFYVARSPVNLRAAIAHYQAYLAKVSTGPQRAIAAEALAELEPIASRSAAEGGTAAPEARAASARTRLMVSSSVDGARIALDDGPAQPSPLVADVPPGTHRVRVLADGYAEDQRSVMAVEGGLVALDVPLRELPARLSVATEAGAEVFVDRRSYGRAPLAGPVEVLPGAHFVAVSRNGRRPFGEEIALGRGESRAVDVALPVSGQRVTSYVVAGAAGVAAALGGVFVGVAVHEQSVAESAYAASRMGNIPEGRLTDYNGALASRDGFVRAAEVAFGAAVGLGVVAGGLYVLDALPAPLPFTRSKEGPDRPAPAPVLEVSAGSAPGSWGASIGGRF